MRIFSVENIVQFALYHWLRGLDRLLSQYEFTLRDVPAAVFPLLLYISDPRLYIRNMLEIVSAYKFRVILEAKEALPEGPTVC